MEISNEDFLRLSAIASNLKSRDYLVDKFDFSSYPAIVVSVGFNDSIQLTVSVADNLAIVVRDRNLAGSIFNVVVCDRDFDWAMDVVLDYLVRR